MITVSSFLFKFCVIRFFKEKTEFLLRFTLKKHRCFTSCCVQVCQKGADKVSVKKSDSFTHTIRKQS